MADGFAGRNDLFASYTITGVGAGTAFIQKVSLVDSAGAAVGSSDTLLGSLTEAAPATDTASSGLNGRLQRIAQRITSLIGVLPAALGAGGGLKIDGSGTALPVSGDVASGSAIGTKPVTTGGVANNVAPTGVDAGDATFDWVNLNGAKVTNPQTSFIALADGVANNQNIINDPNGSAARLVTRSELLNADDTWDRPRGDAGGAVNQPYAMTANRWQYAAAASGISNTTTAVTVKAAHGTLRNYITAIQMTSEALGAATELAVRDGAGGTVIWRTKIGTAGIVNGISIVFPVPLKGTAATLLEVVTLTASITGAVYFNAQGFTAA